jgi:hypothetical protein
MPRIRTIKPEFWGDEKLAPLCAIDRLVFLGLISMADDAGRIVDNIKSIDGFIFPETSDSSRDSLDTLARVSRILRYESESGQRIIQIRNWQKHQKVDKPSRYVLPAPTEAQMAREAVATLSRNTRVPILDLGPTTNDLGSPTVDQRPDAPPAVVDEPAELTALNLVIWANTAVAERWGEQMHPYHRGNAASLFEALDTARVPAEIARESLFRQCRDLTMSNAPRSINYFKPGILSDWADEQERRTVAAHSNGSSTGNGVAGKKTWQEEALEEFAARGVK